MQAPDFKKFLPHLYIIVGFAVLALFFCRPALEGMVLSQHDTISWIASYQETKAYYDSTGINALWTNSMFGGMPNYTIGIPESSNYVAYIQKLISGVLVKPANYLFTAMLCFYILMSVLRVGRWLAAIGALAYAFATYNVVIIGAGHETKMMAISYMPAVLGGLILIYRQKWFSGAALMGISLSLMVGSNHYQVLYYALIMFLFYGIAQLFITLKYKENLKNFFLSSGLAVIVALLGVGPSMAPILTTQEYAKTTMRGGQSELTINKTEEKKTGGLDKDYAFAWSNSVGETFCVLIPYLYGGSSSEPASKAPETEALIGGQASHLPLYWGPQQFLSGPVYFGAVICFLFVLGFLVIKSPHKWWVLAVTIFTIMLSWGKHFPAFNYWMFDNLPMYNKFRTPTMILVIPQLLFPMLGIWGLAEILRGKLTQEELWKKIKLSAGILVGLCVLIAIGGSMFFDYTHPQSDNQIPQQILGALKNDRAALATKSALTSAVYILIAAALLWAYNKSKVNKNMLTAGIGLLIAIDLLSVASNYLNEENYIDQDVYEAQFNPRPVDQQILQDKDPYYRVLDLSRNTYNDAIQAYWHKCIGGYSPAKMEIYQDLIDVHLGGQYNQGRFNASVLNMLNTKYIIFQSGQQVLAQQNPDACGNAWFVHDVKWVNTADEEVMALKGPALGDMESMPDAFNPLQTAIIRKDYQDHFNNYAFGADSTSFVRLTKYGLNELNYVSQNSKDGFAVFSDIWYPYGWEAYVDDNPVEIFRVNYALRGIKIPAGNHNVKFVFNPKSFRQGDNIASISSFLLIGLVIAAIVLIGKGKEANPPSDEIGSTL